MNERSRINNITSKSKQQDVRRLIIWKLKLWRRRKWVTKLSNYGRQMIMIKIIIMNLNLWFMMLLSVGLMILNRQSAICYRSRRKRKKQMISLSSGLEFYISHCAILSTHTHLNFSASEYRGWHTVDKKWAKRSEPTANSYSRRRENFNIVIQTQLLALLCIIIVI